MTKVCDEIYYHSLMSLAQVRPRLNQLSCPKSLPLSVIVTECHCH